MSSNQKPNPKIIVKENLKSREAALAKRQEEDKKKNKMDNLDLLEEGDEFEEFPAEGLDAECETADECKMWNDDWDDDDIEDDFGVMLQADQDKNNNKEA